MIVLPNLFRFFIQNFCLSENPSDDCLTVENDYLQMLSKLFMVICPTPQFRQLVFQTQRNWEAPIKIPPICASLL